jgi:hypothetical protein
MLPTGHIATGVLLGLRRSRRATGVRRRLIMAGAVASTCLPDADLALPFLLDRLGVKHRLNSGHHHSWITHTPPFWAAVTGLARRAARHPAAPAWAPEAARLLSAGVALHLLEDTAANTVAILWPLRRREYGLSLDRMPEEDDHLTYMRRYPATPAGWLEGGLILAAVALTARRLRSGRQMADSTTPRAG